MRILILGAGGMLGHKLAQRLAPRFDVTATVRESPATPAVAKALAPVRVLPGLPASDLRALARILDDLRPDAVLDAVGIIKQLDAAHDPVLSIAVNALFPHQLARLTGERAIRLIHFGTDCVFSGRAGPYSEQSAPDPGDLYGRTKLLGEVAGPGCLTIRSSIVGHGVTPGPGLVDWLVGQAGGSVKGYTRALYSGLTTVAMADLVGEILDRHPALTGVWQVSSEPISKFDLLVRINETYGLGIRIAPDDAVAIDRRLDSSRFRRETGWHPQPWPQMVADMHADRLAGGYPGR